MNSNISLFDLVKSLSGTEKRYLKLSPEFRADGNHKRLFDCYDRMRSPNGALIRIEFENEPLLNQLHVAENALYKAILKTLRNFHAESSVEIELRNQLSDIELLYRKGLYGQCKTILKQTEKIAKRFENQFVLLEVYNWYSELRQVMADHKSFPNHTVVFQNEINSLNAHKNTIEYKKLSSDLFFHLRTEGFSRDASQFKEIEKIILSSQLQSEAKALTFRSKLSYYQLHGAYQTLKGNFEKAIEFQKKVVELLEAHPHQIQRKPLFYLISMNNLVIGQTKSKRYEEALNSIRALKASTQKFAIRNSVDWQTKLFTTTHWLELDIFIQSGDLENGIALIPTVLSESERLRKHINPVHELQFDFAFSKLYFGSGKYKVALKWMNKILNHPDPELRSDIQCCTRMLQIITHYELKDWQTLPYSIINTTRYLKTSKKLYRAESALLSVMRKLDDVEKEKEVKQLKKLKASFEEIFNDPLEKNLLENFDFLAWTEEKIKMLQ